MEWQADIENDSYVPVFIWSEKVGWRKLSESSLSIIYDLHLHVALFASRTDHVAAASVKKLRSFKIEWFFVIPEALQSAFLHKQRIGFISIRYCEPKGCIIVHLGTKLRYSSTQMNDVHIYKSTKIGDVEYFCLLKVHSLRQLSRAKRI